MVLIVPVLGNCILVDCVYVSTLNRLNKIMLQTYLVCPLLLCGFTVELLGILEQ